MLGIFLIYWIGKKFYDLASRHNRSEWGWALLGLAIYYGTQLIFGIVIAIAFSTFFSNRDSSETMLINILGIGVGVLAWYGAFYYFENKWENELYVDEVDASDSIDSIGKDIS